LNNPPTLGTSILHDAPVAVFFTVFKAGLGAQKQGLVILLYTLSQRNRRLEVKWSVMKRGLVGSREWVWDDRVYRPSINLKEQPMTGLHRTPLTTSQKIECVAKALAGREASGGIAGLSRE
jgi:hypothetical protein